MLLFILCMSLNGWAQSKYRLEVPAPEAKLINGFAVGVDALGLGLKAAGNSSSDMQVFGRLNLLEKYFPVIELGIGECEKEGEEIGTYYKTLAPFFRLGADYCLTKKRNGNRLFLGLRYGFCNLDYSFSNASLEDPYWQSNMIGTSVDDVNTTMHWMEICMGVETKLWKYFRMGWSLRYKSNLKQTETEYGNPWYVPGLGKNSGTTFGATVNLIFEYQSSAAINYKKRAKELLNQIK